MPKKSPAKSTAKARTGRATRREFSAGFILFRDAGDERKAGSAEGGASGPLYLLLDYGRHWDYPKGHLEEGETAWQAAVRELREETGIKQVDRVGRFEREMHYMFRSPKKGLVAKTVTYFLGRTKAHKVTLSHEHTGHAWLPFAEAMERLTYDNAREVLRAAHETLTGRPAAAAQRWDEQAQGELFGS